MNASRLKMLMEQQIESLDFIKDMLTNEEKEKSTLTDDELASLRNYVDSIDQPWHTMLKLATALSDKAESATKKKASKVEDKKNTKPAEAIAEDIFDDDLDFLD